MAQCVTYNRVFDNEKAKGATIPTAFLLNVPNVLGFKPEKIMPQ